MTYLLLQTFLLLLASYFLGAFTACLMKRAARREPAAVAAEVQPAPRPVARAPAPIAAAAATSSPIAAPAARIEPRSYEPLQPKIDILARPEPKAAPVQADTSRFDRALAHAVLKDDTPRKCIVEIRPAVLKPVTVRPGPNSPAAIAVSKPTPKPAVAQPSPAPQTVAAKPAAAPPPQAAPQPAPQPASTVAMSSAALAAVAAAKAAAVAVAASAASKASTTSSGVPVVTPQPKPVSQTPPQSAVPVTAAPAAAPLKPAEPPRPQPPAPSAVSVPPVAKSSAFDDFLRIRAIDEAMSQRLRALGVRNFDDIAHWTSADINRINQALGLSGRIEREQWIEQAQILAKGGETYYSRSRAAGQVPSAQAAPSQQASAPTPAPVSAKPPAAVSAAPSTTVSSSPVSNSPVSSSPVSGGTASATATAAAAAAAAASASASAAAAAKAMQQTAAQHQAAAALAPAPKPAPPPAAASPAPAAAAIPQPPAPAPAATPTPQPAPASRASQLPQRSVSEMASAAAAAIAAASASVTRGVRPIEPISPLSKVDPNISRPARLSDAIKERETKPGDDGDLDHLRSVKSEAYRSSTASDEVNDLKRIRGIGVLIEKRLNALGISSYAQIANWSASEIDRISQTLDFKGRIERENWVEQARILSSGGQTEFSRRVDKGDVESSRDS